LLSYVSYFFRLRLLSKDSYLLEGLQSADKTKTHPKAKLQNAPTFTGNGSHSHVCLLLIIKIKTCTYQLCEQQSAYTNVLIIGASVNDNSVYVCVCDKLADGSVSCVLEKSSRVASPVRLTRLCSHTQRDRYSMYGIAANQ